MIRIFFFIKQLSLSKIYFMKKLFNLLAICAVALFSCQNKQAPESSTPTKTSKTPQVNSWSNGSTSCVCGPGQNVCGSSCNLSSCCICWSPSDHQGPCGCYFGIASCKIEKIGTQDLNLKPSHNIHFKPESINAFLDYLQTRNMQGVAELRQALQQVMGSSQQVTPNLYQVLSVDDYTHFTDAWQQFFDLLSYEVKVELMEYINTNYPLE